MGLDRHLFIIGMPGSGKSSLGKRVAKETGLPYADTDLIVAAAGGGTVNDFYARYGDEMFCRAETNALIALTHSRPTIVSTGGASVVNPINRQIMRCWGRIVMIDRPIEDILSDIKLDRRPTLRDGGLSEVERIYRERIDLYRKTADLIIRNIHGYQSAMLALICMIKEHM